MIFWCGSGSADPDPDPAIFVMDLQEAKKKNYFLKQFSCLLLFEGTFTSFVKDKKSKKKSQKSRNQGFSYYFCLMIEESGAGAGSRSIPLNNGPDPDPGGPKTYGSEESGFGFGSGSALNWPVSSKAVVAVVAEHDFNLEVLALCSLKGGQAETKCRH